MTRPSVGPDRRAFLAAATAAAITRPAIAAPPANAAPINNRAVMAAFADMFYRQRDVRRAFETFVVPDYIQHNPGVPDGRAAVIAALTPMFGARGARFDIKHLLVDGDLALVHLSGQTDPAKPGAAVGDVYRLRAGKVVEHWDVVQPTAAGVDPLAMAPVAAGPADTDANRAVMAGFIDLMYRRKQVEAAFERYVAADMIQHDASQGQGRAGAIAALTPLFAKPGASFDIRHVLVDGNLAAIHYHDRPDTHARGAAVVEVFRLAGGRIVEHWDVWQLVPATARNAHPMF